MEKICKRVIWGIMVVVLLLPSAYGQNNEEKSSLQSSGLEKLEGILKEKENHNKQLEAIKESLKPMSREALLTILEEAFQKKELEIVYLVKSELVSRWEQTPPSISLIIGEILDKRKNSDYRASLLSYIGSSKGKKLITKKDKPQIAEVYLSLIKDKEEKTNIRAEAMLNLTLLQPDKKTMHALQDVLLSANEDFLKGSAAHCLKLLGDEEAIQSLLQPLQNIVAKAKTMDEMPWETRCVMVALARFKVKEAVPLISTVANTTNNPDIFGSAVYSLGQIGGTEIILPLLQAWKGIERFKDSKSLCNGSCWAAARHNEDLIIGILSGNIEGDISASIELIKKMQEARGVEDEQRAIKVLERYLNNSSSNIRKLTVETLGKFNNSLARDLLKQQLDIEKEDEVLRLLEKFVAPYSEKENDMGIKSVQGPIPPKESPSE